MNQKYLRRLFTGALAAACLIAALQPVDAKPATPTAPALWVTGYYPAWQDDLKPADIDYASLTHIIYFALFPRPDGSLDAASNGVNEATADALAKAAHKAGKKVIICLGGDGAAKAYRQAMKPGVRDILVKNLVDWVQAHGYDGVDIDFEPMKAADIDDFKAFVDDLRQALNQLDPKMLMTAAVECQGFADVFGTLQKDFDQINLMTYDMAGEWSAETWYNSPLTNDAGVKGLDGDRLPATDQFVAKWMKSVPSSKLGIGVCCEGRIWHGADALAQDRKGGQVETLTFRDIQNRYFAPERYQWDEGANASSIVVPGDAATRALIVYDDVPDCRAKVEFAKKEKLGGLILWEISEEYRPSLEPGKRHPLSAAVHDAVVTPPNP